MKITKQAGVSLLEILISVLILSIGVLGLGGLQLFSLQGSNDAHYRTTASFVAEDLGDRIRINREGTDLSAYAITADESKNLCHSLPKMCLETSSCTPEQLAKFDLYQVFCGIDNGTNKSKSGAIHLLPSATIEISCPETCSEDTLHNITVGWLAQTSKDEAGKNSTLSWGIQP